MEESNSLEGTACPVCDHGTLQHGYTTITLERGNTTVVFKEVPALVCDTCGDSYTDSEITSELLERAERIANEGTLIAVQRYSSQYPSQRPRRIRVLIVDHHAAAREALAASISRARDMELIKAVHDVPEALNILEKERVDVVVSEISLPSESGLILFSNWIESHPSTSVSFVAYSIYDELVFAERALRAGGSGYIEKVEPTSKVLEAIRVISRGGIYVSTQVASKIIRSLSEMAEVPLPKGQPKLTHSEKTVLYLQSMGFTREEISGRLELTELSLDAIFKSLERKLSQIGVSDLKAYAAALGFKRRRITIQELRNMLAKAGEGS